MIRILIVEDNDVNLQLMETILDANGYEYVSAMDGQEAIETAALETFDLVLMDLQMPGVDVFEALEGIRALEPHKFTPVIAVTGNATRADEMRAEEAGFADFVRKPYKIDELLSTIQAHLDPKA